MAKILIVEDDLRLAQMYQKIITFAGYQVVIAVDGEDGLQKVKDERPDLVLLDVMLPKLNGIDLLQKIKANPDQAKIPVMMLTNLADEKIAKEAIDKGALKYIAKDQSDPNQVTELIKTVFAGKEKKSSKNTVGSPVMRKDQ